MLRLMPVDIGRYEVEARGMLSPLEINILLKITPD
jgi:hypothetical protein